MKLNAILAIILGAHAVDASTAAVRGGIFKNDERSLMRQEGGGGGGGRRGGNLVGFCQKLAESEAGECPTRDGQCPVRPICKRAEGKLELFCEAVEAVDDCDVGVSDCTAILTACECDADIDCPDVGPGAPGGRPRNGPRPGPGRPNGGGGDSRLHGLCQKMAEANTPPVTCPTRNGSCPTKAICRAGAGEIDSFCQAFEELDGCDLNAVACGEILDSCGCIQSDIDCEELEWGGGMP